MRGNPDKNWTRKPLRGVPADPGRSSFWSSAQIWRWLTPYERERVERLGLGLNPFEAPGRPEGVR